MGSPSRTGCLRMQHSGDGKAAARKHGRISSRGGGIRKTDDYELCSRRLAGFVLKQRQLVGDLGPSLHASEVTGPSQLLDPLFHDARCPLAVPSPARAGVDGSGVVTAHMHEGTLGIGRWGVGFYYSEYMAPRQRVTIPSRLRDDAACRRPQLLLRGCAKKCSAVNVFHGRRAIAPAEAFCYISSMRSCLAFVLVLSFIGAAGATDADTAFRAGLTAFNEGAYARASAAWGPLAEAGDARAQSGLGFMYYSGRGVPTRQRARGRASSTAPRSRANRLRSFSSSLMVFPARTACQRTCRSR